MSCPYGKDPKSVATTDLTYNDYLKVPELLKLQVPESKPPHHDEMLFIIIHQAYELWFKLILHEVAQAMHHMDSDNVLRAHHFLKRVVEIQKLLVQQIHILETMTPIEFLEFRDRLMPASGFQSMQFREFEFACGLKDERYLKFFDNRPDLRADLERRLKARDLKTAYYDLLQRQGYPIPAIADESKPEHSKAILNALAQLYQNPEKSLPLYLLSESLLEIDEYLALWREHHVRVVERVIGFKQGTGGSSGVQYLRSTTSKKAFPLLWEVRGCLEKRG